MNDDLRALADRVEILELTARYNRAVDDGDVEAFMGLFVAAGALELISGDAEPQRNTGADLASIAHRNFAGELVHATTDSIIEIDGDAATQRCTLLLCRRDHEKAISVFTTGRYTDQLVRTEHGWRFTQRSVTIDNAHAGRMTLRKPD